MTKTQEIATQPSLSPEVFKGFINLTVALGLSGAANYSLEELEKVLGGEPLQKGSELIVTARYFVADMHMPVSRSEGYDYQAGSNGKKVSYKLGGAKLDIKLITVEKIDVKHAVLDQSAAVRCECLVPIEPNVKRPDGYHVAPYPLTEYWAKVGCPECFSKGYVAGRENKAPYSRRVQPSGVIILVDELPEAPDIPEGGCPQCGQRGQYHYTDCPVKAEQEAAAKKASAEAKAAYKTASGKKAPDCFGKNWCQKSGPCEAKEACYTHQGRALPVAKPAEADTEDDEQNDGTGIHQCPYDDDKRQCDMPLGCQYEDECEVEH